MTYCDLLVYNQPSKISPGLNTRHWIHRFCFKHCGNEIKLTDYEFGRIVLKIKKLLYQEKQTIRDLAPVIGSLLATFPVLPYGKLYYKELERCRISSLKFKKGKYNAPFMPLNSSVIAESQWWLKYLQNANKSWQVIPVDCTI